MKYILIVLSFTLIACNSNNKNSIEENSTEISETSTKANARTSSNSRKNNYINHISKHVDFSKCIPYASDDYEDFSSKTKKRLDKLHKEITSRGVKIFSPLEVMKHNGNSIDIAYTEKEIKIISSVFNEEFDIILDEAKNFIKDNRFEKNGEEFYENGITKRASGSFKGEKGYNSYNIENFDDGSLKALSATIEGEYDISIRKDMNGKVNKKELKIKDGYMFAYAFSEDFHSDEVWGLYYLGIGSPIQSKMDYNDRLTSLKQDVSCFCPKVKSKSGSPLVIGLTLADYYINDRGVKSISSHWDSGVYFERNEKYDLNNNTYEDISYHNEARQDTSELTLGRINNIDNLGDINISFTNGVTLVKKTRWERENGSKYKYMEVFYDDKGQEKETVFYFPNGNVKERR